MSYSQVYWRLTDTVVTRAVSAVGVSDDLTRCRVVCHTEAVVENKLSQVATGVLCGCQHFSQRFR